MIKIQITDVSVDTTLWTMGIMSDPGGHAQTETGHKDLSDKHKQKNFI